MVQGERTKEEQPDAARDASPSRRAAREGNNTIVLQRTKNRQFMAGHTLVKILSGFAWTMLSVGGVLAVASVVPFAVVFALTGLEIGDWAHKTPVLALLH